MVKTNILIIDDDSFDNNITYVLNSPPGYTIPIQKMLDTLKERMYNVKYCNEYDEFSGKLKDEKVPEIKISQDCIVLIEGEGFYIVTEKDYNISNFTIAIIPSLHSSTFGEDWMGDEDQEAYYYDWLDDEFYPNQDMFDDMVESVTDRNISITKSELL